MKRLIVTTGCTGMIFLLAASLSAQTGRRTFERVTSFGTETVTEKVDLSPNFQAFFFPSLTPPGLVWNYPNPSGMPWISNAVAVGDRGTQVIVGQDLNYERAQLFSVFDGDPPVPVWEDTSLQGADSVFMADGAQRGDEYVVMYRTGTTVTVNMYRSGSSTAAWSWSPPFGDVGAAKVAMDREPSVVAVGAVDNTTMEIHLFFLDPDTGTLLSTYAQSTPYGLRGWDLSADGSTLYFHDGGNTCYIFDIAANTVVFSADTGGSFDGHCISGDGTKFANGSFGKVKIWEFDGSTWNLYTFPLGSGRYGDEMDFSDDGSTLGFGVTQYSPNYGKTEAYMLDIPTKTVTAHVVNVSNGTYQDVCSSAAISHDGRYFVLGRWGDAAHANPEVQILENGVGLIGSIACRGSCFDVDISWDGQVTVSGGKAVHANQYGNGGDVYCWDKGGEDMDLIGPPGIGKTCRIDVYTNPDGYYVLMVGSADDPEGFAFYPFGTLYLDITPPNLFVLLPVLQADAAGKGSLTGSIPNDPGLVGATLFFQSIFSPDGSAIKLSNDYLTMTVLP